MITYILNILIRISRNYIHSFFLFKISKNRGLNIIYQLE